MTGTPLNERFPWYEIVQGIELQQGDLLTACPILKPKFKALTSPGEVTITVNARTGIVLTQSCDLAVRPDGSAHCDEALLCPIYSQPELANHPVYRRRSAWEEARKGRHPSYHVLNRCDLPGHERDFMLVDFSRAFTLEISLARELAVSLGARLRLQPPYREHLAQAFARFFMRVGLPVDIPPFR